MPYDPNLHQRRSMRLRGYDYAQAGAYFVTICTYERATLFDDPTLRQIAEEQWRALDYAGARGDRAGRVSVDTWVVMPDHVHGIIVIGGADGGAHDAGGAVHDGGRAQQPEADYHRNADLAAAPLRHRNHRVSNNDRDDYALGINVAPGSLGAIVRSYKAAVARRVNRRRRAPGAQVWQRNYYERIIRDERQLEATRRYIAANPAR
jgi:REP element-mobilizing transposase RayT